MREKRSPARERSQYFEEAEKRKRNEFVPLKSLRMWREGRRRLWVRRVR